MLLFKVFALSFFSISILSAKPIVNAGQIKSYLENTKFNIVFENKIQMMGFSADGIILPSGQIKLVAPKIVFGKKFYGMSVKQNSISNYQAIQSLAQAVCLKLGSGHPIMENGLPKSVQYPSPFESIELMYSGYNAAYVVGTVQKQGRLVIDSITCE